MCSAPGLVCQENGVGVLERKVVVMVRVGAKHWVIEERGKIDEGTLRNSEQCRLERRISEWRTLFRGQPYVCWRVSPPWTIGLSVRNLGLLGYGLILVIRIAG
jgi:hypothetical protein